MAVTTVELTAAFLPPARIPQQSSEYIRVRLRANEGLKPLDMTGYGVAFAFVPSGSGSAPVFYSGGYDQNGDAAILVGPNGTAPLQLGSGNYDTYVRATMNGTVMPVRVPGILQIF